MDLRVELTVTAGLPVVALTGPVDLATLGRLRDALVRAVMEHRRQRIAVDLDGVEVLDDAGLGILLGSAARARESGGDLVVVTANPRTRLRFAASGFDRAIELHPNVTAAATAAPPAPLFHVALPGDLTAAEATGSYTTSTRGLTLEQQGFVHCSFAHQVDGIVSRFYGDVAEVVVLRLDRDALGVPVVVEDLEGSGEPFPHVYGPIPLAAVVGREVRTPLR